MMQQSKDETGEVDLGVDTNGCRAIKYAPAKLSPESSQHIRHSSLQFQKYYHHASGLLTSAAHLVPYSTSIGQSAVHFVGTCPVATRRSSRWQRKSTEEDTSGRRAKATESSNSTRALRSAVVKLNSKQAAILGPDADGASRERH